MREYVFVSLCILIIILFSFFHQEVLSLSPSFSIQQIFDETYDYNVDIANTENNNISKRSEDKSDCNMLLFDTPPSDITTVNYYSNGRNLNATIWLSSPWEDPKQNLISREYSLLIDVKSVYDAGITDYASAIKWTNKSKSWTKEVYEFSGMGDERKYIKILPNYTNFFQEGENYVSLSMDLESLNFPAEYRVIFAANDTLRIGDINCNFLDVTDFFPVPSPQYNIDLTENSLFLKPGQEKTIEVKINSTANFPSSSSLSSNKIKGIEVKITPYELSIPSNGIVTSLVNIKALQNATIRPYTLTLSSSIYPNTTLSTGFTELEGNLPHEILKRNTDLIVVVEEPLGILEYVNNALNTWGAPVKEFFTIVTTIGGAGISGWIINKIRHRRKRKRIKQNR